MPVLYMSLCSTSFFKVEHIIQQLAACRTLTCYNAMAFFLSNSKSLKFRKGGGSEIAISWMMSTRRGMYQITAVINEIKQAHMHT